MWLTMIEGFGIAHLRARYKNLFGGCAMVLLSNLVNNTDEALPGAGKIEVRYSLTPSLYQVSV